MKRILAVLAVLCVLGGCARVATPVDPQATIEDPLLQEEDSFASQDDAQASVPQEEFGVNEAGEYQYQNGAMGFKITVYGDIARNLQVLKSTATRYDAVVPQVQFDYTTANGDITTILTIQKLPNSVYYRMIKDASIDEGIIPFDKTTDTHVFIYYAIGNAMLEDERDSLYIKGFLDNLDETVASFELI
ncbi:hypothetical protein [Harryflintia acetispora]|uniref:hypothetical protein n=1 Tax=Harryflintia acetispora TaxID=1849041 RepID=UPI00104C549F|nr:hypothetical protein [Harryflintia acetispora]